MLNKNRHWICDHDRQLKQDEQQKEREAVAEVREAIRRFRIYLDGPKFRGVCEDNISTHEVESFLTQTDDTLTRVFPYEIGE